MKRLYLAIVLLLLPSLAQAQAVTLYVDQDSIGGTCSDEYTRATNSISQPFCTIERADAVVLAGDTVYVREGTYEVDVSLNADGTSWEAPISWQSYPRRAATIIGQTATAAVNLYGDYLIFQGFNVTTVYTANCGSTLYGGRGIEARVSHAQIIDNYVYGTLFDGIGSQANSVTDIEVRGNHIYQCATGIYARGANWKILNNDIERIYWWPTKCDVDSDYAGMYLTESVIKGNYLHDTVASEIDYTAYCTGEGTPYAACGGEGTCGVEGECNAHVDAFAMFASAAAGYDVLIEDNIFYHFHQGIMLADADHHDIIIRGNVFAHELNDESGQAVDITAGLDNIFTYSNTIYDLKAYGVRSQNTGEDYIFVKNSIFSGIWSGYPYVLYGANSAANYNDNYNCSETASPAGANNITSDPLFTSASTNNFYLSTGSPAIDAGGWLTTISTATGSGTSFDVAEAGYFWGGNSVTTGDVIQFQGGGIRTITDITGNTITVDSSVSWTLGDGIALDFVGTAPDMGAYEYTPGSVVGCTLLGVTVQ